jgi:hypothetical protein
MSSLDPAAQPQVKSWRVRADEAGVAFFATATPTFIILALAPASWQGLIFLVGLNMASMVPPLLRFVKRIEGRLGQRS